MQPFSEIKAHVINKLEKGLSPELTYHNVAHTLDVLKQAIVIASEEGVNDEEDLNLLKVSALYHDSGFLVCYRGHEEKSCEIVQAELPGFGFKQPQIEKIFGMIRATKVPQNPKTHLEQIICDSDLDYLGRTDFFKIGKGLFKEFIDQGIVADQKSWDLLQVHFLESHHYFTATSLKRRQAQKEIHLQMAKDKAAQYSQE